MHDKNKNGDISNDRTAIGEPREDSIGENAILQNTKLKSHHSVEQMLNKSQGLGKIPKRKKYLVRIFISLAITAIFLVMLFFGAYYLLLGKTVNSAAINKKVVASVQSVIGTDFKIVVGQTRLEINSLSSIAVASIGIEIFENKNQVSISGDVAQPIAKVGKIEFELSPLSVFDDVPKIKNIIVNDATFNMGDFINKKSASSNMQSSNAQFGIRDVLVKIAKAANKIESYLLGGAFNKLEFKNISIEGANFGRLNPEKIMVSKFFVIGRNEGSFDLEAKINTGKSNLQFKSNWQIGDDGGRVFKFQVSSINAREWLNSPDIDTNILFGIGSDAHFAISAKFPFKNKTEPLQPIIRIKSENSILRIGAKRNTQIKSIELNIRLLPASNQIQIERSHIRGADTDIQFVGGIIPANKIKGYSGVLNFDVVAERITSSASQAKVKTIPVSALLLGQWEWASKHVFLDSIQLIAEKKQINGSADILFLGKSPAINGFFETSDFSMDALRQIWPFFMAANARDWIGSHFSGGYLKNANLEMAVPSGRIFGLDNYIPFEKNELKFTSQFIGLNSKTFGELPPIFDVAGNAKISGSEFIVNVDSAKAYSPAKNIVDVEMGKVAFKNFSQKNPILDIEMHLAGKLSTLMAVANASPLKVAERVLVKPADLSGDALVDVVTKFRLLPKNKVGDLNWNALVTLENASSDKPVFGRALKKANILLEITPEQIVGKGKAQIDGSYSDISFVEPLGASGKIKRKFNLSTLFTQKQLKARGLDFDPIIKGPLGLKIVNGKNNVQKFTVDLTKADISLPWIGWIKGAGIPAQAEFEYSQQKGITTLSKFELKGQGVDAQGSLSFDKSGLIFANLKNITLVGAENFDVNVKKIKGRYHINISGDEFDGRSVINLILHENGLVGEKSKSNFTLNATFGTLIGFEGKRMRNAKIYYKTDSGKVSALNIAGSFKDGSMATVIANRSGAMTTFEIKSNNAGDAFAMANVYSKMVGGTLTAKLQRVGEGPFIGPVKIRKFTIVGEKKLRAFANARSSDKKFDKASGQLKKIDTKSVKFRSLAANIEKGPKYLNISDGIIRSNEIGFTFEGAAFDANDQMNIRGTFMPAIFISRLVGLIPIVGEIFSNGKDGALFGITYRLRGPVKKPLLEVNPISIVTPGIFNKLFEFKE